MRGADLSGRRFGRWTILRRAGRDRLGNALWLAQCECGTTAARRGADFVRGRSMSCGCAMPPPPVTRTHGHYSRGKPSPTYKAYVGVRSRCKSAHPAGICDCWRSFDEFLRDMGERPEPTATVKRRDPSGDFTPDNCFWGTSSVLGRPQKRQMLVTVGDETLPIHEWAARTGATVAALLSRIRRGEDPARAVSQGLRLRRLPRDVADAIDDDDDFDDDTAEGGDAWADDRRWQRASLVDADESDEDDADV